MARRKKEELKEVSTKKISGLAIKKLKLLITVVNKSKATFFIDLLEQFEVNMQMVIAGKGTANSEMLNLLCKM